MRAKRTICLLTLVLLGAGHARGDGLLRTIALSGQPTPHGVGTYADFSTPLLTRHGGVVYSAEIDVVAGPFPHGLFRVDPDGGASTVAKTGDPAPGDGGAFRNFYQHTADALGRVTFIDWPADSDSRGGVWKETPGGNLEPIALAADDWIAPGTDSNFGHFDTSMLANAKGQVAFATTLRTNGLNDGYAAWSESAGAGLSLVARDGEPAPGVGTSLRLSYSSISSIGNDGRLSIGARVIGSNDTGVWAFDPNEGLRLVAFVDDPAPGDGQVFSAIYDGSTVNRQGHVAFLGSVRHGGQGVSSLGIFQDLGPGLGQRTVALQGGPTPATDAQFKWVDRPIQNLFGELLFGADLEGAGVTIDNDDALVFEDGAGGMQFLAREGDPAPGTDAVFGWSVTNNVYFNGSLNARGQAAFTAYVSGPGVNSDNDFGLWAFDGDDLLLVAREGDQFDVSDTPGSPDLRTVDSLQFVTRSGNDDGHRSAFNDWGQIAFAATFTDGTRGVFVSDLIAAPLPTPGDFDGDGQVTQADLTEWSGSYGALVVPFEGADGNGDGVVDSADYTVWRDAMHSAGLSVPEPATIGLAALPAILIAGWRGRTAKRRVAGVAAKRSPRRSEFSGILSDTPGAPAIAYDPGHPSRRIG